MEQKKHIAMLSASLIKGGSERVLVNLADYFIRQGYEVTMVTQYKKDNEYEINPQIRRVISDITDEEAGRSRVGNFIKRFGKLRKVWKELSPDIILSFIGKNNMMAIMTSRFLNIPVAVSVRAEPSEEYNSVLLKTAARILFPMADGVILQTEKCLEFFSRRIRKKSVVLKNPMNPKFFKKIYEGERDKTIVAVGRIDENKNHAMLIDAFEALNEEFPDWNLTIYGEGELRNELIRKVDQMKLSDRISLPGSITKVEEVIYHAGVFVLCSNTEGSPNTLIEAMLLGLPVISTNCPCGGPADLIVNGKNGLLVPVKDTKALEKAIREILSNEKFARELGAEASKIQQDFAELKVFGSWEKYLLNLMKQ